MHCLPFIWSFLWVLNTGIEYRQRSSLFLLPYDLGECVARPTVSESALGSICLLVASASKKFIFLRSTPFFSSTELWFDSHAPSCTVSPWLRSDGCFTLIYSYCLEPKITDLINSLLFFFFLFVFFSSWFAFFPFHLLFKSVKLVNFQCLIPRSISHSIGLFHIFNLPFYLPTKNWNKQNKTIRNNDQWHRQHLSKLIYRFPPIYHIRARTWRGRAGMTPNNTYKTTATQ